MAGNPNRKKGKKNRKFGRNKLSCEAYRRNGKRETNKAKSLRKHLERFPADASARVALEAIEGR